MKGEINQMEALLAFVAEYWLKVLFGLIGAGIVVIWNKVKHTYKIGKEIEKKEGFKELKEEIKTSLDGFKNDVVNTITEKENAMLNIIKEKEEKFEKAIEKDEEVIGHEIGDLNEKHQRHQEILEKSREDSKKIRDLYSKGFLYILKRSYFEDCERLLDPNHTITYDEFTAISEDHTLYKEFGGNGHGDENFELIKAKYHQQTL